MVEVAHALQDVGEVPHLIARAAVRAQEVIGEDVGARQELDDALESIAEHRVDKALALGRLERDEGQAAGADKLVKVDVDVRVAEVDAVESRGCRLHGICSPNEKSRGALRQPRRIDLLVGRRLSTLTVDQERRLRRRQGAFSDAGERGQGRIAHRRPYDVALSKSIGDRKQNGHRDRRDGRALMLNRLSNYW